VEVVKLSKKTFYKLSYKPFHGFLDTWQKFTCERHQIVISGLTFARGSNQPFRSNAVPFLSSSRADIQTFEF
jgi:hypothetical protein